ncbi:MAG: DNRLRE domain-containing protein [Planctomycetota bacterium]|nr:DNRLRE domain-containing protein [Planctomycetota bacterium]
MKVPELRPLLPRGRHARALYVLGTARGETAETEDNLKAAAAESAEAPWPHLASRLRFRTELAVLNELPARIATIGTLIKSGDFEKASTGLAAVSGAIRALPPESVPEGVRTQVAELEGRLRKVERSRIVLQNGVSPEGFEGIRTDQISAQREDTEISDRGVAWGLKIGSFDDLKRVLIGFEGLEKIAGKETRVRKAVLELYQTDNSAAEGAVVGLFRLKRRWVPNAGTWLCYDQSKKARWQIPGASGATDASREPEATVTFDGKGDLWRSWDITSYVRDVIEGRAPNNGLLLRVIHDEPKYHIRFYPETDLLLRPDPKLRPRLVMDLEKTPEGALP